MENTILDICRSRAPKVDMTKMTEGILKRLKNTKIPTCQSLMTNSVQAFRALRKYEKTSKKNSKKSKDRKTNQAQRKRG